MRQLRRMRPYICRSKLVAAYVLQNVQVFLGYAGRRIQLRSFTTLHMPPLGSRYSQRAE